MLASFEKNFFRLVGSSLFISNCNVFLGVRRGADSYACVTGYFKILEAQD